MNRKLAMRTAGAAAVATAVAGFLLGAAGPAAAAAPIRDGWWNTASAGGTAAPSNTPAGELSVSYAGGETLSFSALAYQVSGSGSGSVTLTLQIDTANSSGTAQVQACPTANATWSSGGDQPSSAAPSYDCSAHSYLGTPSLNGKSMTFFLDSGAEVSPGIYSVAIVPQPSYAVPVVGQPVPVATSTPFTLTFQTPNGASLSGSGVSQAPV
ncbi:MAG: hypothetical protein ACYCO3_16770, partial [Mycobacteriales bacterium]